MDAPMDMLSLAKKLFPICRSITGDGVRATLAVLKDAIPGLTIHEVPTGTRVFDWTVPDEWRITAARLTGPDGETVADFAAHNLHVVGYSEPIDVTLTLEELQPHLHSRADMPDAIPYITSYYKRRWGFCLRHRDRERLQPGLYKAVIDSALEPGNLTYGECIIPGETDKEVLLSTYICHPSMANNELSGPVVAAALAKWLLSESRRYTYRLVFVPETIGSITYLSRHLDAMKRATIAGFVLTCLGDDRGYSYVPSRKGNTLADKVALHALRWYTNGFTRYSFLDRGSDERQYCSPGVDLPVCSVMRSKYGCYPEYHTSLDDFTVVTERGLAGGFAILRKCMEIIEADIVYGRDILCEPQMGKRGLYATLSTVGSVDGSVKAMMDFLAYADGSTTLLDIAETINIDAVACARIAEELLAANVIHKST